MATKRTHSRRSCELCKKRKSRCELPDEWVPSSTEPQPRDKSCHRCIVLSVPCVVDDTGRRRGVVDRPRRRARPSTQSNQSQPQAEVTNGVGSSSTSVMASADRESGEASQGQILHDFRPYLNGVRHAEDDTRLKPTRIKTMEFHGRPLRLACRMLGAAFGDEENLVRKLLHSYPQDMMEKLGHGVIQLKIFHPHLPSLGQLLASCDVDSSFTLLAVTVLYVVSGSLPPSPEIVKLRHELEPRIVTLRAEAILRYPISLAASQAFDVLSFHCPLGGLPWAKADFDKLAVVQGQVEIPLHCLDISRLMAPSASESVQLWNADSTWVWLGLMAAQARLALEEDEIIMPPLLQTAMNLVQCYLQADNEDLWTAIENNEATATLVGKLGVCDRIKRFWLIHTSLVRLRGHMDALVDNPFYEIFPRVHEELDGALERSKEWDLRHENLLAKITSFTTDMQEGWLAYRTVWQNYALGRIVQFGMRAFMGTAYIPGTPFSKETLPDDIPPNQRVKFAIDKLKIAANIQALFPDHPCAPHMAKWGEPWRTWCESLLASVGVMAKLYGNQGEHIFPMIPIVEVSVLTLESCKILLEMRGGEVSSGRAWKTASMFRIPLWFILMREAAAALNHIVSCVTPKADDGHPMTFTTGCATLIISIEKLMETWSHTLKEDRRQSRTFGPMPLNREGRTPSSLGSVEANMMSGTNGVAQDATPSYLTSGVSSTSTYGTSLPLVDQSSYTISNSILPASSEDTQLFEQMSPYTAFIAQLFELPIGQECNVGNDAQGPNQVNQ